MGLAMASTKPDFTSTTLRERATKMDIILLVLRLNIFHQKKVIIIIPLFPILEYLSRWT